MQKYLPVFNTFLHCLIVVLFVFIPLYPKFPLLNIKGTFVAIRLEDLLISLTLIIWIVKLYVGSEWKELLRDKIILTLGLFFLIGAVSLFSSLFLTNTAMFSLSTFHFLRRIELMMLLPVLMTVVTTKKQVITILSVLMGVTFIVNVYAVGQQYLDWPVISTTNSEFSKGLLLHLTPGARVNSTFAGHYDLAVFLVMFLAVSASLFFLKQSLKIKILIVALSSFSFFTLIMTAARQSFVAAIAGITISFLLSGKKILVLVLFLVASGAVLYPSPLRDRLFSTVKMFYQGNEEVYVSNAPKHKTLTDINIPTLRMQTASKPGNVRDQDGNVIIEGTLSGNLPVDIVPGEPIDMTDLAVSRSFDIRVNQEWPRAIRAFIKNPLLGTGYSSLGLATDNDFLRLLGEVGILGTLSFCLIFWEILSRTVKNYKLSDKFIKYFSGGILAMITAFIINGLFIDVFEASKVATLFWMILGVNLSLGRLKR